MTEKQKPPIKTPETSRAMLDDGINLTRTEPSRTTILVKGKPTQVTLFESQRVDL